MPGIKRRGGSTPELETSKKPKLQEITLTTPSVIGTVTINGNQNISHIAEDDIEAITASATGYVLGKLLRAQKTPHKKFSLDKNLAVKSKNRKSFIFPEYAPKYTLNPAVYAYLDNATATIAQNLESFLQTIEPMLSELNTILNRPRTRSALIDNKDAILVLYLEKAYTLDQLIQREIKPLFALYDGLKTNLTDYLKLDSSNETLIEIQKFIDTTDSLLAAQKTTVSEQVQSKIASKTIDSLPLKPEIKSWLETIQPTAVVANAIPIATFS